MSRYILCDVCDSNVELDESYTVAQMVFPASWVNGDMGTQVSIDICSTACLMAMAVRLSGQEAPVTGETPDQLHDGEVRNGTFAPLEQPTFVTPVKVKTRGERSDA